MPKFYVITSPTETYDTLEDARSVAESIASQGSAAHVCREVGSVRGVQVVTVDLMWVEPDEPEATAAPLVYTEVAPDTFKHERAVESEPIPILATEPPAEEAPKRGPGRPKKEVKIAPDNPDAQGRTNEAKSAVEDKDPFEFTKTEAKAISQAAQVADPAPVMSPETPVGINPHTDHSAILSHRVGNDDVKCRRCGADTLWALAGSLGKIRICSNDECLVTPELARSYAMIYDPSPQTEPAPAEEQRRDAEPPPPTPEPAAAASGFVPCAECKNPATCKFARGCQSTKETEAERGAKIVWACPTCGQANYNSRATCSECNAPKPGTAPPPAASPPAAYDPGAIAPGDDEISTKLLYMGRMIDAPPAEWSEEPMTKEGGESGGGQCKALNTALSAIGYGGGLRHRAVSAILAKPTEIITLDELTKAEAHIALSWLEHCTPSDIANLAKFAGQPQVSI